MVHGGFYYQVEKRKIYPGELPKILHWFKWEATLTWITGFCLLVVLYYLRGASLLLPNEGTMSQASAVGMSLGIIAVSWFVYDLIWHPRWNHKLISLILSVLFFTGVIVLNFKIFSGRGAFMQTGVIFGTLMVLNVWVRILPGQKRMIAAAQAGQVPDYSESAKSKTRSVANTYFTFPVLFIMLSNHFPSIYNHSINYLLLVGLAFSGALVRHAMVTKKPQERWLLLPASIFLAALVVATAQTNPKLVAGPPVSFDQVHGVFVQRCYTCHSTTPTDDIYKEAPRGLVFETESQIRAVSEKVYLHVVTAKSMPLANKTNMTEEERALVARWISGLSN